MSLTTQDIQQVKEAVEQVVDERVEGLATKDDLEEKTARLATKADLDRMEARLNTSINLLQRDSFSRLDEHEVRIARLEAR